MTIIMKATQFWEDNVMYLLFPAANWQRDHVNHHHPCLFMGSGNAFPARCSSPPAAQSSQTWINGSWSPPSPRCPCGRPAGWSSLCFPRDPWLSPANKHGSKNQSFKMTITTQINLVEFSSFMVYSYLCFVDRVDNKRAVQGKTVDDDVLAIDDQNWSLRNWRIAVHLSFDVLERKTPPRAPGYAWPDLYLLTVESADYRVRYLCTGLEKERVWKGACWAGTQASWQGEQVPVSIITFLKIRLFAL